MSDEDTDFDAVVASVADKVVPDENERAALDVAVERLTERTIEALSTLPVDAEVMQAGSTARGTWLAGGRDIDLFVCFSPTLDSDELEKYGLEIGHAVLPEGREEFAEHPYVVGEFEGFAVDLVPCYAVEEAADIQSSVDRTPFHTRYLRERMTPELARDVRICKQFMRGSGVYGSDLKTEGFSGYLTELLVLEYDGFRPLVEAAADWSPPIAFDPENHGGETVAAAGDQFDDPVVVIDPTDPDRNVAAVLSRANVARFQHFAREVVDTPHESLFFPRKREQLSTTEIRAEFDARGTTALALRFERPDIVDDQLWPQLERSREGIADELDRCGFDVFRTAAFAAEQDLLLLFELAVAERPQVERHTGPPVQVRKHAQRFHDAYADGDASGPFIEDDRYVVERERSVTSARSFLESDALFDVSLGVHIDDAMADEYELLDSDEMATLTDQFGQALTRYLSPTVRQW
ncbi:CCA tRNA nucleotidyltransferase [Halovenus rubra]|uniref:CCA tRNA nucleotidyltransferase n=2 Tax=Halovenus rubra TaxID=869890 RepID=A0ACC7E0E3_9EURY|nr:CCA tRNA nucleotidyltransferase [Halovenus rubra]